VEDEPSSGQHEKNEGDQFGYQNFQCRDRWERHVSPLETRLIILKTDFAIQRISEGEQKQGSMFSSSCQGKRRRKCRFGGNVCARSKRLYNKALGNVFHRTPQLIRNISTTKCSIKSGNRRALPADHLNTRARNISYGDSRVDEYMRYAREFTGPERSNSLIG